MWGKKIYKRGDIDLRIGLFRLIYPVTADDLIGRVLRPILCVRLEHAGDDGVHVRHCASATGCSSDRGRHEQREQTADNSQYFDATPHKLSPAVLPARGWENWLLRYFLFRSRNAPPGSVSGQHL